ncbi:MAG: hypothetical protein A4E66_02404 [Syntrophus sp. PtaB.Bin001]|nr:MAG: hypothetical protein A4E66_02404 [Syntrophus sp. PtaB.Bin001]
MRRNAQIQQVQPSPCNVIPFSELEKMISKQEKKPVRKEIIATEVQESLDHPRLIMESGSPIKIKAVWNRPNSISLAIRIETGLLYWPEKR